MTTVGGILRSDTATVSHDGGHLLVAAGSNVRVYSTATGERLLFLAGHAANVTSICRSPNSETQVYTSSLDGSIKLWGYAEATVHKTWQVGEEIVDMVLPNKQLAVLSTNWRTGESGRIRFYSLPEKKLLERSIKLSKAGRLVCSPDTKFVVAIDRHTIHVVNVNDPAAKPWTLHHTKALTCVAVDSTSTHIAAGDVTGRIIIWSGLSKASDTAAAGEVQDPRNAGMTMATIHWHAHPVGAITFSRDGLYLLSGGQEAVLVIWKLETLKRTFLPRLGGPISHISPCMHDSARYAVCQENNAVRMVALSTMTVDCSIYGVRPAPEGCLPAEANASATCQPGSGYLVLPCMGSQIQFYDVAKDRHISRLAIVPRNLTSVMDTPKKESNKKKKAMYTQPAATCVHFSHDATTMATVEIRPDSGTAVPTYALKFWDAATSSPGAGSYVVNTIIDDPHRGPVTSLVVHPSRCQAVSCGGAVGKGEFRVWVRDTHRKAPGVSADAPTTHWRCQSVGSYKNLPMGPIAFSPDGTVLAIAAGSHITLWHPSTNALMAVLTAPPHKASSHRQITHLQFEHDSPYLIAATGGPQATLISWNLLTLSLWYSIRCYVTSLSTDPRSARFTVAIKSKGGESIVSEMRGSCPEVLRTWSSHGVGVSKVLYAPAGSALYSRAVLMGRQANNGLVPVLVISDDRRMTFLPEGSDEVAFTDAGSRIKRKSHGEGGGLLGMYGDVKAVERDVVDVSDGGDISKGTDVSKLFDAPSHLQPAPTILCSQLLRVLMRSRAPVGGTRDGETCT